MKIIIVGATGTMGRYLAEAFEKEHEIIRVASKGAPVFIGTIKKDGKPYSTTRLLHTDLMKGGVFDIYPTDGGQ